MEHNLIRSAVRGTFPVDNKSRRVTQFSKPEVIKSNIYIYIYIYISFSKTLLALSIH